MDISEINQWHLLINRHNKGERIDREEIVNLLKDKNINITSDVRDFLVKILEENIKFRRGVKPNKFLEPLNSSSALRAIFLSNYNSLINLMNKKKLPESIKEDKIIEIFNLVKSKKIGYGPSTAAKQVLAHAYACDVRSIEKIIRVAKKENGS